MSPLRRDEDAQLQVLEAIIVAVFIFVAMAVSTIYRLPATPGTFQQSELLNLGQDALKVRAARVPSANADCNEAPCPFASDLERMVSLALAYVGRTVDVNPANEARNPSEIRSFLDQALPEGVRYVFYYSNGFNRTQVTPLGLSAPATNVEVARALMEPNWTVHASDLSRSTWVRIGEKTNLLPGYTAIRDPLNRTATEFGYPHLIGLTTRVPDNATLGTHQVCYASGCPAFTVVPPNIRGAGSQILRDERNNWTNLKSLGAASAFIGYYDANGNDTLDANEPLYLDSDNEKNVTRDDVRLSEIATCRGGATCYAGSWVRTGDSDLTSPLRKLVALPPAASVRAHNNTGGASYNEADTVYLDVNGAGATVTAGDRRLSRVGALRPGTMVAGGDGDAGHALLAAFTAANVYYNDVNNTNKPEEGEAVVLNLEGFSQTADVEPWDFHLTPIGAPSARFFYDLKVVVWFGA